MNLLSLSNKRKYCLEMEDYKLKLFLEILVYFFIALLSTKKINLFNYLIKFCHRTFKHKKKSKIFFNHKIC